jgi:hypothetical protein
VAQRVGADTSSPGTAHRYPQTRQRGACPLRSLLAAPIIRYLTVFDCEEYSTFLSFVNSVCIRKSQESCALRNTLHCVDEGSQSSRICGPLPFRALTKRALRGTRRNQQGLVLSTRLARPSRQFSGSHTLIEMRAPVWLLPQSDGGAARLSTYLRGHPCVHCGANGPDTHQHFRGGKRLCVSSPRALYQNDEVSDRTDPRDDRISDATTLLWYNIRNGHRP